MPKQNTNKNTIHIQLYMQGIKQKHDSNSHLYMQDIKQKYFSDVDQLW